jgi:4-hydroxyphenylpyruvate dioxygenase
VEFAANEHEADELGALLTTMGFSLAARHKGRNVTVWRQAGDRSVNVVINTSQEGFAHSSYLVHGTNAYAVGLRVADAAATVARARALGAETFAEQRGAGEMPIPAIRGVGGGVIYFIDDALARVWDVEFDPVAGRDEPGAGLTAIDHVAQTMNYEEMLTWLLFYTAIFRTRKSPMVDVVDPAGLVRSQVVESEDGGLRLTLNGAENRKTLAGHFIAESFGSSVQHIAFATADIFATVEILAACGFRPLEITPNYYEDLEARFALDEALTERLRASNILYDRDQHGEFFQVYSQSFGEGFFFEIVERRGGYKGYGAPNAPFRIAAQKRALRPAGMPRI